MTASFFFAEKKAVRHFGDAQPCILKDVFGLEVEVQTEKDVVGVHIKTEAVDLHVALLLLGLHPAQRTQLCQQADVVAQLEGNARNAIP